MAFRSPGSGKSTWISKNISNYHNSVLISRDAIRFSLLKEDDDYFDKEKIVFQKFVDSINLYLKDDTAQNIFIDATHINEPSRTKILNNLDLDNNIKINIVFLNTPLKKCLERNENRTGRQKVPERAIKNMYNAFQKPREQEGRYKFNIIEVNDL